MDVPSFKNPSLLIRSMTHRSYVNEHLGAGDDNERLEFLGDAVLDFVAGAFLYHDYPEMQEGGLTRLRAALVRAEQLAAFAGQLELGRLLRLGKGEAESGGRGRMNLLADAFEAMIGAYYLDSGLEAVRSFVEPLFAEAAERIIQAEASVDAKSLFQEWAQAQLGHTPRYTTVSVEGPDHSRLYTVQVMIGDEAYGTGTGPSKATATQEAARDALKRAGVP
jgi:ribonuclease-3